MTCYKPMKAFILGKQSNGKNIIKVGSYKTDHLVKVFNSDVYRPSFEERSLCPFRLNCREKMCTYQCIPHYWETRSGHHWFSFRKRNPYVERVVTEYLNIPCGKCLGCRIDYSRSWANRMMLELPYSSESHFITLTYDDDHLVDVDTKVLNPFTNRNITLYRNKAVDPETGEYNGMTTLNKKDLQHFIKRMRKECGDGIRYYACGEYGDESWRCHFHGIFFNLKLDDLIYHKHSNGYNYYISPTIAKLWPFGYHYVCDVSYDTCAYVARYVTKKAKGLKPEDYEVNGMLPEFSLMSRNPGLGSQWFEDNKDKLDRSYIINVSTPNGGVQFKPMRFLDSRYADYNPDLHQQYQLDRRIAAENHMRFELEREDLPLFDYLAMKEDKLKHEPKVRAVLSRERIK